MDLGRDLLPEIEELPVVGPKTAQRKESPETASAEQDQKRRSQGPSGNGVSQKHDEAAGEIKPGAVPDRLEDPQGNAHQIAQQKAGESQTGSR